jgi:hypothetical protein
MLRKRERGTDDLLGGGVDDEEAGGAAGGDEYASADHEELDPFKRSCDSLASCARAGVDSEDRGILGHASHYSQRVLH